MKLLKIRCKARFVGDRHVHKTNGITSHTRHVPSKEPRSKMTLKIAVDGRHMYPGIHQRPSPFRDSASSNKSRHEHFHNEWLEGTCDWFISSPEFWDRWLLGDSMAPQIFYCWGPPGVGKSIITSDLPLWLL